MGWQMLVAFACGCFLGGAAKKPLLEKIRETHLLREIDKAEGAIRELMALRGLAA